MADLVTTASEKKFRMQYQRVLLTYRTHLPKRSYTKAFMAKFKASELHLAWETGHEETPYEHTHVYVDFGRAPNIRKADALDANGIHPHIKPITSRKHLDHVWAYLCKEDHTNDELMERVGHSMADRVWKHDTLQDALREVNQLRDVVPTIQLYQARPIPQALVETPAEWRPWQQKIIDMIEQEPDDRSIVWIHDKKGACGKSLLTRWLKANNKAEFIKYMSRTTDFMSNIAASLQRGWDGRCLVCDLPRDAEKKNLYEPIESFKDGMIQTSKYIGQSTLIPTPHVIVMANFPPDRAKLTQDRWRIYTISEDFDLL